MTNKDLANLIFPNITKTIEDYEKEYPKRNLPEGACVTRFAPSPTGFMHIGHFMQAIIDLTIARQSKGIFYLRTEDTDQAREVEGAMDIIFNTLKHYDFMPDEYEYNGKTVGNYGPYVQSERKEIYHTFIKHLIEIGRAYPCFCTKEELSEMRENQEAMKVRPGYHGRFARCSRLTPDEAIERIKNGEKYVIRFRSNGNFENKLEFDDLRQGKLFLNENDIDEVIMKSESMLPTYHFAHVVDDHLMHTTHVVRGEEWLPSAPKHIQMFEAFGFVAPKYIHTPLIMKKEGESLRKISKRKDPEAKISYFDEAGYPTLAVVESLMTIVNSNYEEWHTANSDKRFDEFVFNANKMSTSGALYDLMKLDDISKDLVLHIDTLKISDDVKLKSADGKTIDTSQLKDSTKKPTASSIAKELANAGDSAKKIRDAVNDTNADNLEETIKSISSELVNISHILSNVFNIPSLDELENKFKNLQEILKTFEGIKFSTKEGKLAKQEILEIVKAYQEYKQLGGSNDLLDLSNDNKIKNQLKKALSSLQESTEEGKKIGKDLSKNIVSGIEDNDGEIKSASRKLLDIAIDGVNDVSNQGKIDNLGKDFSAGYAKGIREGYDEIASAASGMVETALEAIQIAQDSHSPSKVSEKLGEYWGEGYSNGVLNTTDKIRDAVRALVEENIITFQDLLDDKVHTNESYSIYDAFMSGDKINKQAKKYQKHIKKYNTKNGIDEDITNKLLNNNQRLLVQNGYGKIVKGLLEQADAHDKAAEAAQRQAKAEQENINVEKAKSFGKEYKEDRVSNKSSKKRGFIDYSNNIPVFEHDKFKEIYNKSKHIIDNKDTIDAYDNLVNHFSNLVIKNAKQWGTFNADTASEIMINLEKYMQSGDLSFVGKAFDLQDNPNFKFASFGTNVRKVIDSVNNISEDASDLDKVEQELKQGLPQASELSKEAIEELSKSEKDLLNETSKLGSQSFTTDFSDIIQKDIGKAIEAVTELDNALSELEKTQLDNINSLGSSCISQSSDILPTSDLNTISTNNKTALTNSAYGKLLHLSEQTLVNEEGERVQSQVAKIAEKILQLNKKYQESSDEKILNQINQLANDTKFYEDSTKKSNQLSEEIKKGLRATIIPDGFEKIYNNLVSRIKNDKTDNNTKQKAKELLNLITKYSENPTLQLLDEIDSFNRKNKLAKGVSKTVQEIKNKQYPSIKKTTQVDMGYRQYQDYWKKNDKTASFVKWSDHLKYLQKQGKAYRDTETNGKPGQWHFTVEVDDNALTKTRQKIENVSKEQQQAKETVKETTSALSQQKEEISKEVQETDKLENAFNKIKTLIKNGKSDKGINFDVNTEEGFANVVEQLYKYNLNGGKHNINELPIDASKVERLSNALKILHSVEQMDKKETSELTQAMNEQAKAVDKVTAATKETEKQNKQKKQKKQKKKYTSAEEAGRDLSHQKVEAMKNNPIAEAAIKAALNINQKQNKANQQVSESIQSNKNNEEAKGFDNIADSADKSAKAKEEFSEKNGLVLKSIVESLRGLSEEAKGFDNLNNILNKLKNDKQMDTIIKNIEKLVDLLKENVDDNSIISTLQKMAYEGDNLKSLVTILKATQSQITQGKKALQNTNNSSNKNNQIEKIKIIGFKRLSNKEYDGEICGIEQFDNIIVAGNRISSLLVYN